MVNNSTSSDALKMCSVCGHSLTHREPNCWECDNCGYAEMILPHREAHNHILHSHNLFELDDKNKNKQSGPYGWVCPKCGAVMSPWTEYCPNCTHRDNSFTCTSTANTFYYRTK